MYKFILQDDEEFRIDEEYLLEFERKYEIEFPKALREFYLQHHGADIEECSFDPTQYNGLEFVVVNMIPLDYVTHTVEKNIVRMRRIADDNKNAGRLKIAEMFGNYIPFADDIEDDMFYWDRRDQKVYFFSWQNPENSLLICDSVDEFFELMNKSCE